MIVTKISPCERGKTNDQKKRKRLDRETSKWRRVSFPQFLCPQQKRKDGTVVSARCGTKGCPRSYQYLYRNEKGHSFIESCCKERKTGAERCNVCCGPVNDESDFVIDMIHHNDTLIVKLCSSKKCTRKMRKVHMQDESSWCRCVCGKAEKKLQKCSRCKKTYYCSVECQRKDWPQHKFGCQKSE